MTSRFSFDASSVPLRQEGGADSNQIGADDRFVLDSVDGVSSVEELAMMLAMNEEEILDTLDRLTEQRLIHAIRTPPAAVSQARQLQATADFPVDELLARVRGGLDESSSSAGLRADTLASSSTHQVAAGMESKKTGASSIVGDEPDDGEEEGASTIRVTVPAAVIVDRTVPPRPPTEAAPAQRVSRPANKPAAPPPPMPPPARAGAPASASAPKPTRRPSVETPRRHLDPSWWKGMGPIEEPDELLTSREISRSGVLPVRRGSGSRGLEARPKTATHRGDSDAMNFTEPMQRPVEGFVDDSPSNASSDSYPRQTLERPPGGFMGVVEPSGEHTRETSKVATLRIEEQTTEVEVVSSEMNLEDTWTSSETPYVDEVAHTRPGRAPLLPDVELEEDWASGASDEATGPQPTDSVWAEEPLVTALRGDQGGWELDEARRISYYLRLIQNGTYYDIFGVSGDAESGAITVAADVLRRTLRLDALKPRATDEGAEAILNVKRGTARALDVLLQPDARAQYDAALEALAAFKL